MPPHKGHEMTITFGAKMCEKMFVLISGKPNDDLSVDVRQSILGAEFDLHSNVYIHKMYDPIAEPTYDSQGIAIEDWFWKYWVHRITIQFGDIDVIFTNDHYGKRLAEELDAKWMPLDINREAIDISATKLREDPEKYRKYALNKNISSKTIAVVGPESSGKSTMVKYLHKELNCGMVPEYGRIVSELKKDLTEKDFEQILIGQRLMLSKVQSLNTITIADTESYTTKLFADIYLKHQSVHINSRISWYTMTDPIDFYILLEPNMPWVDDGTRILDDARLRYFFFDNMKEYLDRNRKRYTVINSSKYEERYTQALQTCTNFIGE